MLETLLFFYVNIHHKSLLKKIGSYILFNIQYFQIPLLVQVMTGSKAKTELNMPTRLNFQEVVAKALTPHQAQ